MERGVRQEFDKVWAILERTALRGEQAEARFNRRTDAAEKRMDTYLRSARNGHNGGNGHGPKGSR